jgi:hypothetical protein
MGFEASKDDVDEDQLVQDIKIKKSIDGNNKDEVLILLDQSRSSLVSSSCYFIMSLFCLGWAMRLYLYKRTVQVNYYLKKVVLR